MNDDPNIEDTAAGAPAKPNVTVVSANFKMVFISVLGLTLLLLATNVALAIVYAQPSENLSHLTSITSTLMQAGFGAIIGLMGGKSLS